MEEGKTPNTNSSSLIEQLQQFDNAKGYGLSYKTVKKRLSPIISQIIQSNEQYVVELHNLIDNVETWSCLFALEILKEIKSEKSIPSLIKFIKKNENSDYWEYCEEAMYALNAIGKPAINSLFIEINGLFKQKIYYSFLVGSLTEIKDDSVYSFMVKIVDDYIQNPDKYRGWFQIDEFTYDFEAQGNKEATTLLKELLKSVKLDEKEFREIEDTIAIIEDPIKFNKTIELEAKRVEEKFEHGKRELGRNEPCHCDSGLKYKKCCLDGDIKETGKAKKV